MQTESSARYKCVKTEFKVKCDMPLCRSEAAFSIHQINDDGVRFNLCKECVARLKALLKNLK